MVAASTCTSDRFPRFHIGESLIPETYWVFQRLKMLDKMKASAFVKKYSVQFVSANGKVSAPFNFWDNKPHECSQTWQVIRSQFDMMMLDNAREQGVNVHQPARVLEVLFEGDRAAGVRVQKEDGTQEEVRARVVVDASGQSTFLQNRFKLRLWDPVLNKGAIWTYWEGAYRAPGQDGGATLVIQTPNKQGWWWYIPQLDKTVSVGVVAPFDYLFKGRGTHEKVYNEEVEACPAIKERISIGRRAAGYFATKDYSYRSKASRGTRLGADRRRFRRDSSTRSIPPGCCWRSSRENLPPTPSPRGWRRGTCRRRNWANGDRCSTRAWTACAASSANTTTASASAISCALSPN